MYARLVRFEGADPGVMERDIEEMRRQMASGSNEDPSGRMNEDQMAAIRRMIKRVVVLADRDKGSSAMVVFTESEEEIRQLDQMFDQMSPGEGGGKRESVDIYEVAIDEQTGG